MLEQHHRMVDVGWNLWSCLVQPLLMQGHPEQPAHACVQVVFEDLQEEEIERLEAFEIRRNLSIR